ncbi:MAG TPA: TerC family protein [Vicinamibacterales bacterium]|nr:TerC family protein [Vicinamibacterales bacterium]
MPGEFTAARFWLDLLEIMGINILLSGDNAVVIALASRSLPTAQRRLAILGGSAGAMVLRIVFCLAIVWLLQVPYVKLVGGLLLLYVAVKLVVPDPSGDGDIAAKSHLWGAIQTIVVADAVMSLDNVVAIAAAAHGSVLLIILGLALSIPLIVFGSQLVLGVLNRYPALVLFGGGLLGWIAGEIIVSDPLVYSHLPYSEHLLALVAKPALALTVVACGMLLAERTASSPAETIAVSPEEER